MAPTPLQQTLFALQDPAYRQFNSRLLPTVDPASMIGVRVPALRRLAKTMPPAEAAAFLQTLPHTYFEENQLHAFLIGAVPEFDAAMALTQRFLPFVDNWATCDGLTPRAFRKDLPALRAAILRWLQAEDTFTLRFAVKMVMDHFLAPFDSALYAAALAVRSSEYYVQMMQAWLIATALAKAYDAAVHPLEAETLPLSVHNKAIQKAIESDRIPTETKAYLRTLRRKNERGNEA